MFVSFWCFCFLFVVCCCCLFFFISVVLLVFPFLVLLFLCFFEPSSFGLVFLFSVLAFLVFGVVLAAVLVVGNPTEKGKTCSPVFFCHFGGEDWQKKSQGKRKQNRHSRNPS